MFGFFDYLGRLVMSVMQWCNDNVFFSYALTIIVFTGVVKVLTLPFDIKQRASMAKMTSLQPEIKALQKRYAGNPETLQKKTMELYKENHYSQLSGCLPMLAMMVFFIVFVGAARQWGNYQTINLYLDPSASHFMDFKWFWIKNIFMPDSGLAKVVMPYAEFIKIPFDNFANYYDPATLASLKTVTEVQYNSVMQPLLDLHAGYTNGWFVLPIIAGLTTLLMSFMTSKVNPQQSAQQVAGQPDMAGMNKTMMWVMAAMSVWFCITSNAAFAIYWIASNIFSVLTTVILNYKTLFKPKEGGSKEASK